MTFTFKIKLDGSSKPPIWRKVKVNGNLSFDDLHIIIQVIFDWDNSHLYQFSPKGYASWPNIQQYYDDCEEYLTFSDPETFPFDEYYESDLIKLKDYFKTKGQKMVYIYDFGDDWKHIIELTDVTDENILRPQLIAGKSNTPVEDSGGIYGYYNMADAINDPKHPEHEEFLEWLDLERGTKWDVNEFNLVATNALLQQVWNEWERVEEE